MVSLERHSQRNIPLSQVFYLNLPNTKLAYRVYENPQVLADRTAVFIHGAGVGGELTWSAILEHLSTWRRIIVPDLKGMGDSYAHHANEEAVSIDELAKDIWQLITSLDVKSFDLVGYSLGGLVSLKLNQILLNQHKEGQFLDLSIDKMCLLEPASLDREDNSELVALRNNYKKAAMTIRETGDVELGIAHFVDSVAPNRRKHPIAEATTQSRLAHRALGFSYALDAVTDYVERDSLEKRREMLLQAPPTLLLAGDLSHAQLKNHYDLIAQNHLDWHYESLSACDHSLPFQKPRQIAKKINKWFAQHKPSK